MKRPWLALTGLLLIPSLAASSDSQESAAASYRYQGYALAQGILEGSCEAGGTLSQEGLAGHASITSAGGTWEHYKTTYNETTLWPNSGGSFTAKTDYRQNVTIQPVPAGNATLRWAETGRANTFLPQWPQQSRREPGNALTVTLQGSGIRAETPRTSVDPYSYPYLREDGQVGLKVGGIGGWNRLTTVDSVTMAVDGDLVLYLEDAQVTLGRGEEFQTPPRERFYPLTPPNDVLSQGTAVRNYVLLRLKDAHVEFLDPLPRAACGPIQLQVQGTFTALGATGNVSRYDDRIQFDRKEFTLNGTFLVQDQPADLPLTANTTGAVEGRSEGEFQAVGIDFVIPSGLGPEGIPKSVLIIATTAAAGVGALALLLAKGFGFFTRLGRTSVEELPNRLLIIEKLRGDAWIGLTALARGTGVAEPTVRYHLRVLEREQLIVARGRRKARLYAVAGQTGPEPYLIGSKRIVIPEEVRSGPTRQRELVEYFMHLGFGRSVTWYAIKRWEAKGRLIRSKRQREVWYEWRG